KKINVKIEKLNAKLIKKDETRKKKILENLTDFKPLGNYKFCQIDETTSAAKIQELINEAKKTYKFTVFQFDDIAFNMHYVQIELIQQSLSIIINVELIENWQIHSPVIQELFIVVFHRSKSIKVWAKPDRFEYNYEIYELYNTNGILNCHIVYVQDSFKTWCNKTFNDNKNCGQILDFEDIDGPLCTCSYRPLKNFNDTWDLKQAIAYTFEERLDPENFHLYKCLAITKLATVINEEWNYEKLQDYIQKK
ncbi:unnamed protein product, partial [Rotaria sordida]